MSCTDEQLVADVREALRTAPLRPTVPLDEVVAVGRRRVRARRALGAGGVLVAAAVAGAVAFSLGGSGLLGAAPFDAAGDDGRDPSVTLTAPPEAPQRLYDALDARFEVLGLQVHNVHWESGSRFADPRVVDSAFSATALLSAPSDGPQPVLHLETVRMKEPMDLTGDLCAGVHTDLACTQSAGAHGTQLLRLTFWQSELGDGGELVALQVVRSGGWVRVDALGAIGSEGETLRLPEGDEATLLEIVTDPALQW